MKAEAGKRYLIVGQGLAGTILSMKMQSRGIDHMVVDQPELSASSKVAGGLINPVVLKRFKMVFKALDFLDQCRPFYEYWEEKLQVSLYHPTPIFHLFSKQENQNEWMEKSANHPFNRFLGPVHSETSLHFTANFGVGQMKETAWVRTNLLLDTYRDYLISQNQFKQAIFDYQDLEDLKNEWNADHAILCTGHLIAEELDDNILSPTRGELLTIRSNSLPQDRIYHAGVFILPIGNSLFKLGATYHWDNLKDTPTPEGKSKLLEGLSKIFNGDFEIVDHVAGVRPNVKDRKPLLGSYKDHFIFNGLGSRGVLMGPLLADILLDNLQNGTPIPSEYDINRFSS